MPRSIVLPLNNVACVHTVLSLKTTPNCTWVAQPTGPLSVVGNTTLKRLVTSTLLEFTVRVNGAETRPANRPTTSTEPSASPCFLLTMFLLPPLPSMTVCVVRVRMPTVRCS